MKAAYSKAEKAIFYLRYLAFHSFKSYFSRIYDLKSYLMNNSKLFFLVLIPCSIAIAHLCRFSFQLCTNTNTYINNNSPGQAHQIDLHGLHVTEAIPLLKREIIKFLCNVRSTRQQAYVFICVGIGHHTKGSQTPSRLPINVQKYLLEEEHIQFTEPQAGMLRIIIR